MSSKKNRVREAIKEGFNMVGLAGAVALSAATLNPVPLLVGLVVEAAYLLFVPDSRWYMSRLSVRSDAEVEARRAQLKAQVFPLIAEPVQHRFERLERIRGQLGAQPDMERQDWFRQVVRKLDYLLEKFLMFASKEAQFRAYLQSVSDEINGIVDEPTGPPSVRRRNARTSGTRPEDDSWPATMVQSIQSHYEREIASIQARREKEDDRNTQAILDKRIEVLQQRREYVGKIGRILSNLGHQMGLLEDSFGLINDQIRARSPEQVLADIEGVVYQTDSMMQLLEELAPYEEMSRRLSE